ncbi:MAG: GumC family protein, partial [Acidobacteriota bacterium]|nr:GumC family protein [Acidobacteriota bacterium]
MMAEDQARSGLPQLRSQALLPARRPGLPVHGDDGQLGISFDRYLKILLRRKWAFLAVIATVVSLAALEAYTTTPLYESTARLQIDPEELNVLPYQDFSDPGQMYTSFQYQMTQLEKLRSRELARQVVERLNLAENHDFQIHAMPGAITLATSRLRRIPSALLGLVAGKSAGSSVAKKAQDPSAPLVDALRARVSARPVGETRLIEVSYTSPVPSLAAEIANSLAEEFVRLHVEGRYRSTGRATEFLERELEDLKGRVESSQEELLQYARGKKIIALSERESLNRKKLADLTDQLTEIEAELAAQGALVREVVSGGPGERADVFEDEHLRGIETQLGELESELAGLSSRYGPEWPTVKELKRKIAENRSQLEEGRERVVGAIRQSYSVTRSRYDSLMAAIEEQKRIVDQLDDDSIQYNILRREAETNQELYEGLLQRLK